MGNITKQMSPIPNNYIRIKFPENLNKTLIEAIKKRLD